MQTPKIATTFFFYFSFNIPVSLSRSYSLIPPLLLKVLNLKPIHETVLFTRNEIILVLNILKENHCLDFN